MLRRPIEDFITRLKQGKYRTHHKLDNDVDERLKVEIGKTCLAQITSHNL